ncbi:MAG: hypothetical protein JXB23_05405 [Candidatus Aminicenantes bacterium]|nr:hypothetical protein [Candidatus Aminicenantes bacterium]
MGLQRKGDTLRPFFLFHLGVGIRIALRKVAAVVVVVFALFFILRYDFFSAVLAGLLQSQSLLAGSVFALIGVAVALMASPRVCFGLTGWIRHLPASSTMHRRLAAAAVFVASLPVLLFLAFLAVLVHRAEGIPAYLFIAGLPVLGLAAALCVLPVKQRYLTIPLAVTACVCASSNRLHLLLLSFLLLVAADRISGPLTPVRRHIKFSNRTSGFFLSASIAWRALRFRIVIPYLLSFLVLGLTRVFVQNNTFPSSIYYRAVCFGGALSLFLYCAVIAGRLSERRPSWPWARSLPWSARERVFIDAVILGFLSLPQLILIAVIDVRALWPVLGGLPLLVVAAALIMRRGHRYRLGAMEMTTYVGAAAAVTICLLPWISLLYLALTPLALKVAADEEKNQKVSRWHEMQHLAAGDSLSLSK